MSDLAGGDALSTRALVDTNHGETDGPGAVADRRLDVLVVCLDEVPFFAVLDHEAELVENIRRNLQQIK